MVHIKIFDSRTCDAREAEVPKLDRESILSILLEMGISIKNCKIAVKEDTNRVFINPIATLVGDYSDKEALSAIDQLGTEFKII